MVGGMSRTDDGNSSLGTPMQIVFIALQITHEYTYPPSPPPHTQDNGCVQYRTVCGDIGTSSITHLSVL